jgi:hypothetical protein
MRRYSYYFYILFVGLMLTGIIGCGTSISSHAADVSSTPSPTETAPLTHVDWANFTYFSSCYENKQPFKARNGTAMNDHIMFQVYKPVYGDLTRDGQAETAIPYSCAAADFGGVRVFVYSGSAAHPVLLGDLPLPDKSGKITYWSVDTVSISNEEIHLVGKGDSPSAAHCCPDLHIEMGYRWNGSHFVVADSKVSKL